MDLDGILGELCELESQLTTAQTQLNQSLGTTAKGESSSESSSSAPQFDDVLATLSGQKNPSVLEYTEYQASPQATLHRHGNSKQPGNQGLSSTQSEINKGTGMETQTQGEISQQGNNNKHKGNHQGDRNHDDTRHGNQRHESVDQMSESLDEILEKAGGEPNNNDTIFRSSEGSFSEPDSPTQRNVQHGYVVKQMSQSCHETRNVHDMSRDSGIQSPTESVRSIATTRSSVTMATSDSALSMTTTVGGVLPNSERPVPQNTTPVSMLS